MSATTNKRNYIVVVEPSVDKEYGCYTCGGTGEGDHKFHPDGGEFCEGCHFAGVFKAADEEEAGERAWASLNAYPDGLDDEGTDFPNGGYTITRTAHIVEVLPITTKKASAAK